MTARFKASHTAANAVMARRDSRAAEVVDGKRAGRGGAIVRRHSVDPPVANEPETKAGLVGEADAPTPTDPLLGKMIRLPTSMWAQLDEVWHVRRLPSQTATIRELLTEAMAK